MQRVHHFDQLQHHGWDGTAHNAIGCWVSERDVHVVVVSLSNLRVTQSQHMAHHGVDQQYELAEAVIAAIECLSGTPELVFVPFLWMASHVGMAFEAKSLGVEQGQVQGAGESQVGSLRVVNGHRLDLAAAAAWVRKTVRSGEWPEPILQASRLAF